MFDDWFKNKKYKPEIIYLNENNIKVFWVVKKNIRIIYDWIIDNKEFEPQNNELLNKLSELQLNVIGGILLLIITQIFIFWFLKLIRLYILFFEYHNLYIYLN